MLLFVWLLCPVVALCADDAESSGDSGETIIASDSAVESDTAESDADESTDWSSVVTDAGSIMSFGAGVLCGVAFVSGLKGFR
jgi:fructoselysine-6-P-deglycase FrlB-like protein